MGMFDDLIPTVSPKASSGAFDDLIPKDDGLTELDKQMDERVAKEGDIDYATRTFNKGMPWGSWTDEGIALVKSVLPQFAGGMPYNEAVALERARDRAAEKKYSGTGGTALKVGGALLTAPLLPAANVFRGQTLLPAMGNAAITGAGYGAAYGAGQGEGDARLDNAMSGAAIGGAIGGAVTPLARGAGNAIQYVQGRAMPQTGPLAGMERRAVSGVVDDMQSSGLDQAAFARQRADLGNQGMLLDMGDDLRLTGEALANTNGPQMQIMREALQNRANTAQGRIASTLDSNLGQPVNIPQTEQLLRQHYGQLARPHYDQFHNTSIPITPQINTILEDIPGSAYAAAQRLARAEGYRQQFRLRPVNQPMTPMTGVQGTTRELVPTGIEYDYLKRAVDDLARSAERGSNEHRVYSDLARRLRTVVDETLSPGAPDQSSWAIARSLAGDGLGAREAMQEGGRAFSKGVTPDQMAATRAGYSQLENAAFNLGARDQLHTTMGNAATNFRSNGDAGIRRQLNSTFARDKLEQIMPLRNARNITRTVDAENRFADTSNQILANSATARRTAAQRRLPMSSEKPLGDNQPRSINEAAFVAGRRVLNAVMAGGLNERANRIMSDQARMLTARGVDRDAFVNALLQLGQRRGANAAQRDAIVRIINALGSAARTPMIESAISQRSSP